MNKILLVLVGVWWTLLSSELFSSKYSIRENMTVFVVFLMVAMMGYITGNLLKGKN
jgi:hypothetical protein